MGLEHRIKRLERGRGPRACPACGGGGPGPVVLNIPMPEINLPGEIGLDDDRPQPGDFCAACGRKRVLRIGSPRLRGAA